MPEDLPYKHKKDLYNDVQSDEGYKYSGDNKYILQCQYPTDKPYVPRNHEKDPLASPPLSAPSPPAPRTTHAYPEAQICSTSSSSSPVEPCSEDDIPDLSSSCSSSSSDSPSVETDSREGRDKEEEELPDLDGGGGMGRAIDSPVGEDLRGEGVLPIQQVRGWKWEKDR